MLSLRDCLDMAEVTESEIAAIARHEHIPHIVALELGHYLLRMPGGANKLRQFIVDNIAGAQNRHRCAECEKFSRTLSQYLDDHPECRETGSDGARHLLELAAIGPAEDAAKEPHEDRDADRARLDGIEEAKCRDDCCACAQLSLELLRSLDPLSSYSKCNTAMARCCDGKDV